MQEASNELIEMLLDVGEDQIASKGYLFLSPVFFPFQTCLRDYMLHATHTGYISGELNGLNYDYT